MQREDKVLLAITLISTAALLVGLILNTVLEG